MDNPTRAPGLDIFKLLVLLGLVAALVYFYIQDQPAAAPAPEAVTTATPIEAASTVAAATTPATPTVAEAAAPPIPEAEVALKLDDRATTLLDPQGEAVYALDPTASNWQPVIPADLQAALPEGAAATETDGGWVIAGADGARLYTWDPAELQWTASAATAAVATTTPAAEAVWPPTPAVETALTLDEQAGQLVDPAGDAIYELDPAGGDWQPVVPDDSSALNRAQEANGGWILAAADGTARYRWDAATATWQIAAEFLANPPEFPEAAAALSYDAATGVLNSAEDRPAYILDAVTGQWTPVIPLTLQAELPEGATVVESEDGWVIVGADAAPLYAWDEARLEWAAVQDTAATAQASPTTVQATPTTVAASPTAVQATPTTVAASPTAVQATPTTVAASPTAVQATPTTVAASPTAVQATPTTVATGTTAAAGRTAVQATPTNVAASPTTVAASPTAVQATPTTVATGTTAAAGRTPAQATPTTVAASPTAVQATPTTVAASTTTAQSSPTTAVAGRRAPVATPTSALQAGPAPVATPTSALQAGSAPVATPTSALQAGPAPVATPTSALQAGPAPAATAATAIPATPAATAVVCNGAPPSRIQPGDTVTALVYLNARISPGLNSRWLRTYDRGTPLKVIGGPECIATGLGTPLYWNSGGEYLWWFLQAPDGSTGWSAEGYKIGPKYYLEPLK